MNIQLEKQFDDAMMDIYKKANSEANYTASRFLQMLTEHRGLETARLLLHSTNVSEGYTALWEKKRLDLTVEALIQDRKWHQLFTTEELQIATNRLKEYGFELHENS